jgi:hypothetical protein
MNHAKLHLPFPTIVLNFSSPTCQEGVLGGWVTFFFPVEPGVQSPRRQSARAASVKANELAHHKKQTEAHVSLRWTRRLEQPNH